MSERGDRSPLRRWHIFTALALLAGIGGFTFWIVLFTIAAAVSFMSELY